MEYYYLIVFIIVIFAVFINRYKRNKKVYSISINIKKLNELNENYLFLKYSKKFYLIKHKTKSKASLRKITFEDIILYNIENNISYIKDNIEKMICNKRMYLEYMDGYDNLNEKTPIWEINTLNISEHKFYKIESKLMKKNKHKDNFNLRAYVYAHYTSPKARNKYKKAKYFRGDQLAKLYEVWKQKKNFQITAKFERSKMSDSLRYDVLKRDDFRCKLCGVSAKEGAKLHVDHIKPVSKGGKTQVNNLQTLCERCNLGKSNKF